MGNRSSQGPAQQATAMVTSFKVARAVVVLCTMPPWGDRMRPLNRCLGLRSVDLCVLRAQGWRGAAVIFFTCSSGLFTACSKQAALTAHGCHSKGCKSWGQQNGETWSKNNPQLRGQEEPWEPAPAFLTRLTVYIPLLMVTHSPLMCAGSLSGRRGNATWVFLFWRAANCKIDQIIPTCLNISQPLKIKFDPELQKKKKKGHLSKSETSRTPVCILCLLMADQNPPLGQPVGVFYVFC